MITSFLVGFEFVAIMILLYKQVLLSKRLDIIDIVVDNLHQMFKTQITINSSLGEAVDRLLEGGEQDE